LRTSEDNPEPAEGAPVTGQAQQTDVNADDQYATWAPPPSNPDMPHPSNPDTVEEHERLKSEREGRSGNPL
jgi:hypothetical protein